MRQPIVLQVEGLGVPVVSNAPSANIEMRWSSDPDISADAPAYLFRDANEVTNFLSFAVDKRFINQHLLTTFRVEANDDARWLPRAEAEVQGVGALNWDLVRVGLIISGNSKEGPVSDALEWVGQREEYQDYGYMRAAFEYASSHKISGPTIVTHNEARQTLAAAEYMTNFHQSIKPQAMIAHQVLDRITAELHSMDLEVMSADRAKSTLVKVKAALIDAHEQENQLRESLGMEAKSYADLSAEQNKRQPNTDHEQAASLDIRLEPEPGPELFTPPRMG
ncbi:hypothetical protein SJI00_20620 [Pseudomonas sp. RP23018S]|uniref:hypothetical protein n=1 Tax=Pseudomonas sp. RP23018S TaxID=3096037 RepID=UPI002ACA1B15|nr:hypothetical protein [Pseudomonas sp. RP23018S]MDZ5605179.1 hypothetical protein [Pseudomonas sp. RP23018S]